MIRVPRLSINDGNQSSSKRYCSAYDSHSQERKAALNVRAFQGLTLKVLFCVLFAAASQREPPSLSGTLCEQTPLKQFGIVKTLIDLFFRVASDAEETPVIVYLQRFKLSLKIGCEDLITPRGRRVVFRCAVCFPLLVSHSVDFPLYRVAGASCDKTCNLVVLNTYRQGHGVVG